MLQLAAILWYSICMQITFKLNWNSDRFYWKSRENIIRWSIIYLIITTKSLTIWTCYFQLLPLLLLLLFKFAHFVAVCMYWWAVECRNRLHFLLQLQPSINLIEKPLQSNGQIWLAILPPFSLIASEQIINIIIIITFRFDEWLSQKYIAIY